MRRHNLSCSGSGALRAELLASLCRDFTETGPGSLRSRRWWREFFRLSKNWYLNTSWQTARFLQISVVGMREKHTSPIKVNLTLRTGQAIVRIRITHPLLGSLGFSIVPSRNEVKVVFAVRYRRLEARLLEKSARILVPQHAALAQRRNGELIRATA